MDIFYLDCGTGNAFGDGSWCGNLHGPFAMYGYDPISSIPANNSRNVLGAEVCMWSERANGDVLEARLWPRVYAMGERFWSNFTNAIVELVWQKRMVKFIKHIRELGIKSEPITSGLCERTNSCS